MLNMKEEGGVRGRSIGLLEGAGAEEGKRRTGLLNMEEGRVGGRSCGVFTGAGKGVGAGKRRGGDAGWGRVEKERGVVLNIMRVGVGLGEKYFSSSCLPSSSSSMLSSHLVCAASSGGCVSMSEAIAHTVKLDEDGIFRNIVSFL